LAAAKATSLPLITVASELMTRLSLAKFLIAVVSTHAQRQSSPTMAKAAARIIRLSSLSRLAQTG
jgi:hypothetical protein